MGRETEETPDAAAGIANRCEGRIGIDPEAHVAGGISNAGVWESGDKVKDFFFVAANVSPVSFAWFEPISVRAGSRGESRARV